MKIRMLLSLVLICLIVSVSRPVTAQTASGTSPEKAAPPKAKSKKVYTEEDLRNLRSNISVVGDSTEKKVEKAEPTEGDEEEGPDDDDTGAPKAADKPVAKAKQEGPCKSKSWAKIIENVTRQQGLPYDSTYWHQRIFGNTFCMGTVGSIEKISGSVQGEYVLDNGSHATVVIEQYRPLPSAEDIVPSVRAGKPFVFVWKGQPYLTETVEATETVAKGYNGETRHISWRIKRFRLFDPDAGTIEFFTSQTDKASEIDGSLFVTVKMR
jgi:hypothetical protein